MPLINLEDMCLYPKFIENAKYKANKKNKGIIPKCNDERLKKVPIACGKCKECCKAKSREWRIRLTEEMKTEKHAKFVTLTFSNEELIKLCKEKNTTESNAIAKIAVKRFLERHRKKYKKSIKHWLITELGHENTERIHLHGILFKDIEVEELTELWKYGFVHIGKYCNSKTINYIIKYATKIDNQHKGYTPIILTSPGIGKGYIQTTTVKRNYFNDEIGQTKESYRLPNGHEVALPIYYRNKIYNEEMREALWLQKLDKGIAYLNGQEFDVKTEEGLKKLGEEMIWARRINEQLGFGNDSKEWKKKEYNITYAMLRRKTKENAEKERVEKLYKNG